MEGLLILLLVTAPLFRQWKQEDIVEDCFRKYQKQWETREVEEEMKRIGERRVKEILEQVEGVGKADVMLTLQASKEKVTLKDNKQDDTKTEEETVLLDGESRESSPYVVQEIEPQIERIVVVCSGGDSPAMQREIISAISALFPVESHKIKVMKSKEAK